MTPGSSKTVRACTRSSQDIYKKVQEPYENRQMSQRSIKVVSVIVFTDGGFNVSQKTSCPYGLKSRNPDLEKLKPVRKDWRECIGGTFFSSSLPNSPSYNL